MDIKDFSSGTYRQWSEYRSFSPALINHEWTWSDASLNTLLERATHRLGELNAFSLHVPDVAIFIRMHIAKEATTSSRIEGTQTKVEEALQPSKDIPPEQRNDWQEVHNYIVAMNQSVRQLARLPVSTRLIQDTHRKLMRGVRGTTKLPGEYRRSQNWVGGASLKDAVFVPPSHEEVAELMSDLEKFLNNDAIHVPHLVRAAIAHYQFETIHPFLDGNGRVGRLLITLSLVSAGLLARPTLYLSAYFERNRELYYDNLSRARTHNALAQWLKFFLVGIEEIATEGVSTLRSVLALKDAIERGPINNLGKRLPLARSLVEHLYHTPVVTVTDVAKALRVTYPTANVLLGEFVRIGIVQETSHRARDRRYVFRDYVKLFGE